MGPSGRRTGPGAGYYEDRGGNGICKITITLQVH